MADLDQTLEEIVAVKHEEEAERKQSNNDKETNEKNDLKSDKSFSNINLDLLHAKGFYFFFNSALGSLWPYLPLYFRQIFLTPRQVGAIVAARTFTQFLFTPFWSGIAEKYNSHKSIILLGVLSWFASTLGLLLVPTEQPKVCAASFRIHHDRRERSTQTDLSYRKWFESDTPDDTMHELAYGVSVYNSSLLSSLPKYAAYDPDKHVPDSSHAFLLLLLITVLGISISAPTLVLADHYTLQRLGSKPHKLGQQLLWGSIGFGAMAFIVGASVSILKRTNPCTLKTDINYLPCFAAFAAFMALALFACCLFNYDYSNNKTASYPGFLHGIRSVHDVHLGSLLVVIFFCGTGSGFISTFLLWHLREMGAAQLLLALVCLINGSSEMIFYSVSSRVIRCLGHFGIVYLGLLCFAIRFFYYSFLHSPWFVLPIEIMQGMTSAGVRSSFVSYVGQEPGTSAVLQGLFSGVHSGLGFSVGGFVGGIMVHEFGHTTTFLIFGEISLVIMFSFILINSIWPKQNNDIFKQENDKTNEENDDDNNIQSMENGSSN